MKRLLPIIFSLAIVIGVLAPVTASITADGGIFLQSAEAQTASGTPVTTSPYVAPDSADQHLPDCGANIFSSSNDGACLEWLFYYIPFDIGEWAMGETAKIFDTAASFTLSSRLYTAGSFLQEGWGITRDFANIFFIIILLAVALSLVLGIEIGHANPKKILVLLVAVALFINFSFFLTEVVIDISNALALVFYNQVTITSTAANGSTISIDDGESAQLQASKSQYITNVKPLSIALARSFMPQVLTSASFYNKLSIANTTGFYANSTNYSGTVNTTGATTNSKGNTTPSATIMIPILIIIGAMYLVVAYSFIVAMIALMGRLINLWIAIIFAPLAFVSFIVPSARHIPGFGWDEWIKGLMTNAFAAPIYFFFILLISILTHTSILPTSAQMANMSPGIILTLVIIQFLLIITLLLKATSYVKAAAGEIGSMLFKAAGVVGGLALGGAGLAVGSAAGVVAIAGRQTVGVVGAKLSESKGLKEWASGQGSGNKFVVGLKQKIGKAGFNATKGLSSSSFDVRQNGLANLVSKQTGIGFGSFGPLSTQRTAGGLQAAVARKDKKDKEFGEKLGWNRDQEAALKDLKGTREGDAENLEAKLRVQQKDKNDKDGEVRLATAALKSLQNTLTALKNTPGTSAAAITVQQNAVNTAQADLTQKTRDAEARRLVAGRTQKQIDNTKSGLRDPLTGRQRKLTAAEVNQPGGYIKANGSKATTKDIDKTVRTEDLSIADIDKLIESNQKALAKAYMHHEAVQSGYHVGNEKYDKQGNLRDYHISSNAPGEANWTRAATRGFSKAVVGTAIGTALAGPIGAAVGFAVGGSLQGLRELFNGALGNKVGSSYTNAEAAHHSISADTHQSHDFHSKYTAPSGGGVLGKLKSLFSSAAGSGGGSKPSGGGHSSGHGGH